MCGIVGAVAERNVVPILLEGLRRLEYRGYDSAGIAVLAEQQQVHVVRRQGKVAILADGVADSGIKGITGIAHTRWATHGKPNEQNAHPHVVGKRIAIVHNGIIENYKQIQATLTMQDYAIASETDTEVVAAYIYELVAKGHTLLEAIFAVAKQLHGAFAIAVLDAMRPGYLVATRHGSPLVVGIGVGEYFLASDPLALQKVAQEFIYLEEGDVVEISSSSIQIYDSSGKAINRTVHTRIFEFDTVDKGNFRHFMQKEIFEQSNAIAATLMGRIADGQVFEQAFGLQAEAVFDRAKNVQIVACGTSYYAGLVAKHWLEDIAGIPCQIEIASEFRYRKRVISVDTLFVTISQSGETADTLAALRSTALDGPHAYCGKLTICNVPESSLVRESDMVFLTHAGPEVGVASTKAFTTQLASLLMLALALGKRRKLHVQEYIKTLQALPVYLDEVLKLDEVISDLALSFEDKQHAIFLGRGINFPLALEGALKLKEISYIHAEAYPGGELKHGPLALVDKHMPVVVIAPPDHLLSKILSNIEEVYARGGQLIVITGPNKIMIEKPGVKYLYLPEVPEVLAPMVYTLPMQLLAYHVAVLKGTDVDHPRNLAKSVTVE